MLVNLPGQAGLGEELLQQIAGARQSVAVVNPLLSDKRLIEALISARLRGLRVKVITELRQNRGSGVTYPTRGFKWEAPANLEEHFVGVRALTSNRVTCRGLWHYAHPKLLLVDDETMVLSSANGTANSLGWGPQLSLEAGVCLKGLELVGPWVGAFTELWEGCHFRMHLQGSDVSLQQEPAPRLEEKNLEWEGPDGCGITWSCPPHHRGLRDRLLNLIRSAQERVLLVAMSFFDTDQVTGLQSALAETLERGVRVCVMVRPEHFPPNKYPDPSTRWLMERGLKLYGLTGLHAKGALADTSACAILSANINPFSLDSEIDSAHLECGLYELKGLNHLAPYAAFLERLVEQATHVYKQ